MQSPNVKPEQASAESIGGLNHTMEPMDMSNPHHNGNVVAGTKRKVNSASPRGVANLTPEQLARKRANDRQAQRAIRERTKAQIEALERRVHELTSQQPYQDIQNLVSEKERIIRENQDIKRRLSAMMNILQPLMERDGTLCVRLWKCTANITRHLNNIAYEFTIGDDNSTTCKQLRNTAYERRTDPRRNDASIPIYRSKSRHTYQLRFSPARPLME